MTPGKLAALLITLAACGLAHADEQLIVFVQRDGLTAAPAFADNDLPKLRQLAADMKLGFKVIDITAGAPQQVGITPLVVFQNHRGRSVYQGRYKTLPRIKNFVRTARVMPKLDGALELKGLPVMNLGRAKVGSPIKLTPLTGTPPEGFDQAMFAADMNEALAKGFTKYRVVERAAFGRSDRLFYFDFYPHRSANGKLFVGVALFSQFHCHAPVYTAKHDGPWAQRHTVFAKAAADLERAAVAHMSETKLGDGFDALPADTPIKSYEALGLPLPPKPKNAPRIVADVELSTKWRAAANAGDAEPVLQFSFAPPLDGYAGEVTDLTGHVKLGKNGALTGATGRFVAAVKSLTMGEEDLDEAIHTTMLMTADHPEASFTFDKIESRFERIAFGRVTPATLVGRFTLMNKTIDLAAAASVEPIIGDDGRPRLVIDGSWQLNQKKHWGLDGPPGHDTASNTMVFRCHIVLAPAG